MIYIYYYYNHKSIYSKCPICIYPLLISQFAMENHHAIKFGKPSISMGHLDHVNYQRVSTIEHVVPSGNLT